MVSSHINIKNLKKIFSYVWQGILGVLCALIIVGGIEALYTLFLEFASSTPLSTPLLFHSFFQDQFYNCIKIFHQFISNRGLMSLITGVYISSLGLFFNICEIWYMKRQVTLPSTDGVILDAAESLRVTKRLLTSFVLAPIGFVMFFLFVLPSGGCNRIESMYFIEHNKVLLKENLILYFKKSALFHCKVIYFLVSNIIFFLILFVSPLVIIRCIWTYGFWGMIAVLVLVSKRLSSVFNLTAEAPLFSMILTLSGVVISISGYF